MEKFTRDRSGEIFEDDLTENETKAGGEKRDDTESSVRLDTDVDSQEADDAMAENRFGINEKKSDT